MLHQLRQVNGTLFRCLVLPVVAQGVDADHRIAKLGHLCGHVAVQVTPAAVAGEEQGHGVGGLACRDLDHRDAHGIAFFTHQSLGQLCLEHLRQVDVVIADAGFGVGLIAYEGGAGVVRVVVPGDAPVAVSRRLGQRCGAARAFDAEIYRDSLGFVIALASQPVPGLRGTGADARYQGCRALQLLQCLLQGGSLQGAVGWRQDHLNHLRLAALAQVQQLLVGQCLVREYGDGHAGFGVGAGGDPGQAAAIRLGQVFQLWFRRWTGPQPEAQGCDQQAQKQCGQKV
ncbi:hypothetical protein D3C80_934830 [compost metagenome]